MGSAQQDAGQISSQDRQSLRERLVTLSIRMSKVMLSELVLDVSPVKDSTSASRSIELLWFDQSITVVKAAAATLRANMSLRAPGFRHTARLAIATTAAFLVVRTLRVPCGYWGKRLGPTVSPC